MSRPRPRVPGPAPHPTVPDRRVALHHLDVDGPGDGLVVAEGITHVLVLVHHRGAVIGQTWLEPGGTFVPHDELLRAVSRELGHWIRHRTLRLRVEEALGRPPRDDAARPRSVSVVVCTRDRAEQLHGCLSSLLRLRRPGVDLLVVDNGSRDDATRSVCAALGVRCVGEPEPGQTRARNRGIAETTGELVAFTDDDVVVDPGWLDGLDRTFDDPSTMIATGYIGPLELEAPTQVWFEAHGGFKRHPDRLVVDSSVVPPLRGATMVGAGANMVLRRSVLEDVGAFDVDFGAGTPTRTSDDKLFFYRVLAAGHRIDYDPSRKVWHQHRRDPEALRRIMRDYGTGEFTWTTHVLRTWRDLDALLVWRWWLRHFLGDLRRLHRGDVSAVPAWVTRAEVDGMFEAPAAFRTVARRAPHDRRGTRSVPAALPAAVRARVTAEDPPVTVTVASYNRREPLGRVLRCLAQQDLPTERFEVVVVIDGSTDGSAAAVRAMDLPYATTVVEQPNRGLAAARNAGARAAAHPLVVFLDDDIEATPAWLGEHVRAHAATRQDTFVMGYFPPTIGNSWIEQEVRRWWLDHFRRKGAPGHRWTLNDVVDGNSSMPVRLLERVGMFDEQFTGGRRQDYELGVRLLSAGAPLAFHAAARAEHRPAASVATTLRNARQEGRYDATLVAIHPTAAPHLPLDHFGRLPRRLRPRAAATLALGIERSALIAQRLEALGQRPRWDRFLSLAWEVQYRTGLGEGLRAHGLDGLPPAAVRRRVEVPLDAGAAPVDAGLLGDVDLVPTLLGRPLARVTAMRPAAQWDWDDVIHRTTVAVETAERRDAIPGTP